MNQAALCIPTDVRWWMLHFLLLHETKGKSKWALGTLG